MHFHKGANLTHLKLSVSKFGIGFQLPSDVLKYCKLSMRQVLFKSINKEIQDLFHLTSGNYIHTDSLIVNCEGRPRKELSNQIENNVLEHITTLKEQGTIMQIMRRVSSTKIIRLWNKITFSMPKNLYVFIRNALIFSLPNNSNLKRWGKVESDYCSVYGTQRQTQLHMLANCSVAATEGRYTWRHDSILFTILQFLSQLSLYGFVLYGDLDGYRRTSEIFQTFRPYIALIKNDVLYVIELTRCFETNAEKSREKKQAKYRTLQQDTKDRWRGFQFLSIEITSLGIRTSHFEDIKVLFKGTNINLQRMISKCMEVAMRASVYIYIRRNEEWTNPSILKFH